jgi:hypothetical protein
MSACANEDFDNSSNGNTTTLSNQAGTWCARTPIAPERTSFSLGAVLPMPPSTWLGRIEKADADAAAPKNRRLEILVLQFVLLFKIFNFLLLCKQFR